METFEITHANTGANLAGASIVQNLETYTKDPDAGFRLSRHIAKKDKNGNYSGLVRSKGVIVPDNLALDEAIELPALRHVLSTALQDAQDRLIRSLIAAGSQSIPHAAINLVAVEEYLSAQPEALGKLSAEKIAQWFDAHCADVVILRTSVKLFNLEPENLNEEQAKKVTTVAKAACKLYQRAAERNPHWEDAQKAKLLEILADCEVSPMGEKLKTILSKQSEAEVNLEDML